MALKLVAEWKFEEKKRNRFVHLRIVEASGGKMRGWLYTSGGAATQVFGTVNEAAKTIEFAQASGSKSIVNVVHYAGALRVALADKTKVLRIEGEWSVYKLKFGPGLKFKGFERVSDKFKAWDPQPIIN